MDRIMLVMDDFTELQFLSSVLQKLGFDVMSFNKEVSIGATALGFAPGLLIATAKGRAVDGAGLVTKLRKQLPAIKSILVYPSGRSRQMSSGLLKEADAYIEMPVEPGEVLTVIAQLLQRTDSRALIEKYQKIITSPQFADRVALRKAASAQGADFGGTSESFGASRGPRVLSQREQRYQKFLAANDEPVDKTLPKDVMQKAAAEEAAGQTDSDKAQHELKKEFVRTLFRK